MSAHLHFPRLDPDAVFTPDPQDGRDGPALGGLDSFPPPAEAGQEPGWDELALSRLTLRSDASVHARRIAAAGRWGASLGLSRVPTPAAGDRMTPPPPRRPRRPRGSDFPPSLLSRLDGSVRSSVIAAALPAPPAVRHQPAPPASHAGPAPSASLTLPRLPVVLTPAARPAPRAQVTGDPASRLSAAARPLPAQSVSGQGSAGQPALSADAEKVVRHLSRTGVAPAAELKALLGKSQPTLSRVLRELGDRVVALGAARARRYALPQPLDGGSARLHLHWVDEAGQRQPWGELTLLAGDQVHVRGPELDLLVQGGLPWFLAPLQREGTYLGRLLNGRWLDGRLGDPLGGLSVSQPWGLAAQLQAASRLGDAAGAFLLLADLPASAAADQEAPFPTLDLSPPLLTSVVAAPADLADLVELSERAGASSGQLASLSPSLSPALSASLPHTLPGGIPALASLIAAHPDQLPLPLRRRQASPASRLALYDRLAERLGLDLAQAAQGSIGEGSAPGSAALPRGAWLGGSQPKLLCRLSDGGAEVVKFSPRLGSPLARRLSDLLHAEATALAVLAHAGVATAEAEILVSDERVYLATQRIDRVPAPRPGQGQGPTGALASRSATGSGGRRHIVNLAQAHQAFVSAAPPRHWSATAQALALQKRLPAADAERIAFLQAYAQLIGSNAQLLHKLPLQVTDLARGRFVLAPLYSLPAQRWRPDPLVQDDTTLSPFAPDPAALASSARPWAALYWQTVAGSAEFSLAWRRLAQEMATRLER